ncbi:WD40 repeat protein, partial [Strigomonas culicis]
MKTSVRWSETSEAVKGIRPPINSLCYSPSGDYIVATCGVRILVYAATAGTLLHSLQGHTDTAYCVDYSHDGKIFASGGADRTVIIWSNKAEGVLKYAHKDPIQALAFNPTCNRLCSVSNCDWGVWSMDVPNVGKAKLPSKGLCAAWTQDGQNLAIGTMDGTIIIINKGDTEKQRIRRNAPVWTLAFSPLRESGVDVLAVGSWDQKLSFYNLSGNAVFKERNLDYDPCSISFFNGGEYILIGGSQHKVTLYTKDGNRLVEVAQADDWVWCARQHPKLKQVSCGTNDGTISVIDVTVTAVHTFYSDQYIFRENMTNVMVHQLTLDRRMVIPCNDYVQKLSTYRDRLAVQFEERIVVFELFFDDERNMRYQDVAQIRQHIECDSICVTSNMLVFCKERRMSLYDLQGSKMREWSMESPIRFAKLIGGDEDAETILVGLKNGQTLKVFVDNSFPTMLVKLNSPIRSLDLNCMRTLLAVVDENNILKVFNLTNKNEILFQENSVTAAVWNTDFEDMIAYSTTNNVLNIKTSTLPAFQQTMRGTVIGFKANRLFNLHNGNLTIVDIPHSHALYHYIEAKDFDKAYSIASRGVAEVDWKMLGLHAMTEMNLDIARKAFTQIREVKFVELLHALELNRRQAGDSKEKEELLLADILAFQGKYSDAARKFIKCNNEPRAIEMYCDLKMWDEAKKVCSDEKLLKNLIRQQAHWSEDSENYVEAASLYEACGDFAKAISMMGQGGQVEKLLATCRKLPKSEVALISECAHYFKQFNNIPYAIEAFEKVGDNRSLIQIYVDAGDWKNAFTIIEKCPQYAREVYVPWAGWLGENDMFEEALEAFRAARWPKEAIRMMETLASNSVVCRKFRDAAFYLIHLADEYGTFDDGTEPSEALKAARILLSKNCVRRGEIYYAFSTIFTSATQPFVFNEMVLFRQAKYVLAMVSEGNVPMNVGKAEIL